jgi:hypothetical protein
MNNPAAIALLHLQYRTKPLAGGFLAQQAIDGKLQRIYRLVKRRQSPQQVPERRAAAVVGQKDGGKAQNDFSLRLEIPQKTRDSSFFTAAAISALQLYFRWRIMEYVQKLESTMERAPDLYYGWPTFLSLFRIEQLGF